MTSRQIDSAGAAKWLSRAMSMARSIPDKTYAGTKRKILDGYVVEGRKAGKNRAARVYDLPGRIVPFGPVVSLVGINTSSIRPFWVQSPTRGITLDALPPDEPYSIPFDIEAGKLGVKNQFYLLGPPPTGNYSSLFSTPPTMSTEGAVQARLLRSANEGITIGEGVFISADYSNLSSIWLLIERMGAGSVPDFRMLINEQVLQSLFGLPIIQRDINELISLTPARAWATTSGRRVLIVVLLGEDKAPIGFTNAVGFVSYIFDDGQWLVERSTVLHHNDINSDLFKRHTRVSQDEGNVTEPLIPEQVSGLSFPCSAIAFTGDTLTFVSTIQHRIDARSDLPDHGLTWGTLTVTGQIRCDFNVVTGQLEHEINNICCDAGANTSLTTSLGFDVTSRMSTPFGLPQWPVYSSVVVNKDGLHHITGLAMCIRGDTLDSLPSEDWGWRGEHTYQGDMTRFTIRREYVDENGLQVVEEAEIDTNEFAFRPGANPGGNIMSIDPPIVTGIEDGFGDAFPVALIGLQRMESPFYIGGSTERGIARLDSSSGQVSSVPLPAGAAFAVSTCYALAEETDGDLVPHRSVVSYRSGGPGVYTIEFRRGDEVIAKSESIQFDIRLGAYYMGNPSSGALYGQIPGAA